MTDLNLSDNDIRNTGANSLSKALRKNTTLTNLDLGDNAIDNSGVVSLTGALSVNISLNLNLSGITFNYSHVLPHVQSRLSVTRHQENDGCADHDDGDEICDDDSNSGNSIYSGGNESCSDESTSDHLMTVSHQIVKTSSLLMTLMTMMTMMKFLVRLPGVTRLRRLRVTTIFQE